MCRIFGYIGQKPITNETLEIVSKRQIHGGPDSQHFIQKKCWALGNNRLAIQGLDGGLQPFQWEEKIYVVFNGEIYNHNELRILLSKRGFTFQDSCDGSILTAMYLEYGMDFVKYLDGMFAIAVIDTREHLKLILATDPTGIKSVYYHWDHQHQTLHFSSEIPALHSFSGISKELRKQGIDDYLTGKAIWGPETVYKDIFTLPPSSLLIAQLSSPPRVIFYTSQLDEEVPTHDIEEAGIYLNEILDKEVKMMMLADVPVCVVTSGGLDSSYVTALARKYADHLHSFNIWYEGNWPQDERHFAKEVADQYGTIHHQVIIREKDYLDGIERMLGHIGQPNSAGHCLSTYVLFEAVSRAGFKVALTGEGADEFFGGYTRFATASSSTENNWLETYLDKLSAVSKNQRDALYSPDYQSYLDSVTKLSEKTSKDLTGREQSNNNRLKTLLEFDQVDRFPYYILRRVDHLSMAHAVETRIPFCQPRIANLSRKMPNHFKIADKQCKKILYHAAQNKLPASVLNRPKQPFLLPITQMLQPGHVLFNLMMDTLTSLEFKNRDIFKINSVNHLIEKQRSQPDDMTSEALWTLTTLELWLQQSNAYFA